VLRHRKFRQSFRESFEKISAPKIEFFRNFATIFKTIGKKFDISNFDKNKKLGEHIVYVISQLIFWGQRNNSERRQNIAKSFTQNFRQNFGKIL